MDFTNHDQMIKSLQTENKQLKQNLDKERRQAFFFTIGILFLFIIHLFYSR